MEVPFDRAERKNLYHAASVCKGSYEWGQEEPAGA